MLLLLKMRISKTVKLTDVVGIKPQFMFLLVLCSQ